METLTINDLRSGYLDLVTLVRERGERVVPRGQPTRELREVIIQLVDPYDALPVGVGRRPNLAIAAAEAIQLVGAFSNAPMMTRIAPAFKQFLEPGGFFHGAYGRRIQRQLAVVWQRLSADPDSRQAIATLWDSKRDMQPDRLDYPCTLSLTFLIRHGKLELHTTMRSNDVWLGVAYDFFQFTQLQLTMARALGRRPGPYFHHAVSLHAYERDFERMDKLHEPTLDASNRLISGFGPDVGYPVMVSSAMERARLIAGVATHDSTIELTSSERWYADTLEPYINGR